MIEHRTMRFILHLTLLLFAVATASAQKQNPEKKRQENCPSFVPSTTQRDPCVTEHQTRLNTIESVTIPSASRVAQTALTESSNKLGNEDTEQNKKIREIQDSIKGVTFNSDRFWVLLAAVLVFFMQAGFKCLEVGMVQPKFDTIQATQKLFSWIMTFVGYYPAGFGIMFGITYLGITGVHPWDPQSIVDAANQLIKNVTLLLHDSPGPEVRGIEFFLFQAAFAATAVTIPAGATAERISLKGYVCAALFISLLVYPVFGHWAWGGGIYTDEVRACADANSACAKTVKTVLKAPAGQFPQEKVKAAQAISDTLTAHAPLQGRLQKLGFHDFAGSTVVHSVGGWFALIGTLMLGARKGRFNGDGSVNLQMFPSRSRGYAVLGVFMLWFGWWGFNGGSQLSYDQNIAKIILNTNLAGAAAGLSAYVFSNLEAFFLGRRFPACTWFQRALTPEKVIGGVLGGLVAITASCDKTTPVQAFFLVGITAGIVHNLVFDLLLWLKIDDPVGAFPVHTGCGILGTLLVSFTYDYDHFWGQLGVQARGASAAFAWTVSCAALFFWALRAFAGLRFAKQWRVLEPAEPEWVG